MISLFLYFLFIKYLFFVFLPFLFAILFYFMMKPFILFLERVLHIRRHTIGMILLLMIYMTMIAIVVVGVITCMQFLLQYVDDIPYFYQSLIEPLIQDLIYYFEQRFSFLFQYSDFSFVQQLGNEYIIRIMSVISLFLSKLPSFLFSLFIFMVSTVFLFLEYDMIVDKISQIVSKSFYQTLSFMKETCLMSLKNYMKCQGLLMILFFFILWIGFMIIKVHHPFVMALITAWFDSLPFIGVGIILIPMIFIYIFQGIYLRAFYLFLLYMCIVMMRGFLESRIMRQQMKIPSFILLLSTMVHFYLFGFIGVLLSPFHLNLLYSYLDIQNKD